MIIDITRSKIRFTVGARSATISGEAYRRGFDSPDFVAYGNTLRWDDGSILSEDDRSRLLAALQAAVVGRGMSIEIEP
jgi:hypothetical protein